MKEVSKKLETKSVTEIVLAFRQALISLYPMLVDLDILADDTQPYDDFDQVAEKLWEVLVVGSLKWKFGIESDAILPPYGFQGHGGASSRIVVYSSGPQRC